MRFYNPLDGEITFDGEPIQNWDLRSLRRNVGYVGQEPVLFNDTIEANMRLAKPDAENWEIDEALKLACCKPFVDRLSHGT